MFASGKVVHKARKLERRNWPSLHFAVTQVSYCTWEFVGFCSQSKEVRKENWPSFNFAVTQTSYCTWEFVGFYSQKEKLALTPFCCHTNQLLFMRLCWFLCSANNFLLYVMPFLCHIATHMPSCYHAVNMLQWSFTLFALQESSCRYDNTPCTINCPPNVTV